MPVLVKKSFERCGFKIFLRLYVKNIFQRRNILFNLNELFKSFKMKITVKNPECEVGNPVTEVDVFRFPFNI